jgi:threonine aldolase
VTIPPPARAFASDNAAGAHPLVIDAVVRANDGHVLAYGDDPYTRACEDKFRELFDAPVETLLAFNGTGANVLALASLLRPAEAVVCTDWAHIAVDETGAPERVLGVKLMDLATPDGKLRPEQLRELEHLRGVQHHAQPGVVSITQSTELGGVYTIEEVTALCDTAHSMGMRVHLDGARIANATAALGGTVETLRAFTIDAGVDVVSFGGTKNGLLGGEAVVYLDPTTAGAAKYLRKQVTQLPSKMRFVAAQFDALLTDGLWLRTAAHANDMARRLYDLTEQVPGVSYDTPPVVNSVFPCLPAAVIEPLRDWCFFWDWDTDRHQVRWMTAWDTSADDVATFADGVREFLAACN